MTDRIAIVTGASGGIGHAVAVRLARAGMAVAVHYSGNRDRAQTVADEITTAGGRALVVGADVADEAQIAALFDATGFWDAIAGDPFDRDEWLAAVRAAPAVKANFHTVLSARDTLPEVERHLTDDARLARCFR